MEEKDPSTELPPEIACIHRKWNVRSVAYRTLITHFQKLHPSSDDWGLYKNVISNIAAESFPAIREQALEAVFQFVQKCDTAQKISTEVIHSLLDTIPNNTKPRAKHLLEQIVLQYVEIGSSRDVIEELLRTALINQVVNVATTCIEIITKILSVFGPTAIDLAYVLETLPYLQEAEELEFRSATKALILEIYRWQGKDSIKNVGQILNPADLKDVLKKYDDAKNTAQLKPTRHVRNNKHITHDSSRSDNAISDQETDLLKQITDEFFRKLESPEWTERRDALMELRMVLESSYRLRPDNYEPLLAALKKVITEDQCVIVVGLAIVTVTGIAKGLRQQFSPYAIGICRILLEKFVEKRQNITEQLRKALDVLTTTTSFESLIKTINNFLGSKNPTIRFETIQLLSRMFKKTTRQTLRKPEFSVLYRSLVDCLHHGQIIIREKSFIALAVAFKIAGEGVIMPYLQSVDPMTKIRIKNYNLDQDFEEKYNEIKYRNVAKKELKNEDKLNARKENSSENIKDDQKIEKDEINEITPAVKGNHKTETQNTLTMNHNQKRMKSLRKRDSQPVFNYNKVTKRWSSSNSNVTLERFYIQPENKNPIEKTADLVTPFKEHRKKEIIKKYPYRRAYTVQKKEIGHCFSKEKKKKKKIFSFIKNETSEKSLKEVLESSHRIGDNIIMNMSKLSNNSVKIQPEILNNMPLLEYHEIKDSTDKNDQTVKGTSVHLNTLQTVSTSYKEAIKMENMTPSASTPENSDLSQPVQQSVQTLDSSLCGEGFIVLTETEVKKLLGLKRISAVSDDSCCILPDWTSKRNLFKRSYKIFQVSKDATDRETQTSLTAVESTVEMAPEGGVIDLIRNVDVIPTQTAGVRIEERGTDARRIKRYNRGTQWVQHLQTEIRDTTSWSKRETSSEWKGHRHHKNQESQNKGKKAPLKMQSVVMKNIEYQRPPQNDFRSERVTNDQLSPGEDHTSKRTMEINTYTVTRSNLMNMSKNTSESLTSVVNTRVLEKHKSTPHEERTKKSVGNEHNRRKQHFTKSYQSEDMISKNSNNSKQIKKIKKKYTHEIMVKSNKETTDSRQNNISNHTLIRLKKIEHSKHHTLAKGPPRKNVCKLPGFAPNKSELSIRSSLHKSRRPKLTKKLSKLKPVNINDTSSGSCKEGCNFLPFVAKSIMGHQDEEKQKKNNNTRKKQHKHKPQRNARRGNRPTSNEVDQDKSEHILNRSSRKCYSAGDRGPQTKMVTDAKDMDPQTKQVMIKELLKVCNISQTTFEKMAKRKASPPRPCLFAPKAVLHRVVANDSPAPEQEASEEHNVKDHKTCVIM